MSHPPYGVPPVPQKYRPRARWFVVGVTLLVLAGVSFAGGLLLALHPLAQQDAIVSSEDGPVTVDVPAGEERALFVRDYGTAASCTVTDRDGEPRRLRPVSGDFTSGEWTAEQRFDTGAGDVVVDCGAAGSDVRVGQVPSTGEFVLGLVLAILGSIGLGLAGLVVLVVTGILYAVRPARPRTESIQAS